MTVGVTALPCEFLFYYLRLGERFPMLSQDFSLSPLFLVSGTFGTKKLRNSGGAALQ
jgi:hypothetical protein